jgi:hypothetical protein
MYNTTSRIPVLVGLLLSCYCLVSIAIPARQLKALGFYLLYCTCIEYSGPAVYWRNVRDLPGVSRLIFRAPEGASIALVYGPRARLPSTMAPRTLSSTHRLLPQSPTLAKRLSTPFVNAFSWLRTSRLLAERKRLAGSFPLDLPRAW